MSIAKRSGSRRGTELIEFSLVALALLPVLFGTVVVGLNLGRSIQVMQVSRDSGHMYARSVDFSAAANQQLIERLALGLNIKVTGGTGVVILSTVTFVGQAQCDSAGLEGGACTNLNQHVIVHRVVVGDSAARQSNFGTPSSGLIRANGEVSNYLTDPTTRAVGFAGVLQLNAGELAYVSEVYVPSVDYGLPGYRSTGVYARAIF